MKFRTEIIPKKSISKIVYSDKVLTLGSCFSVETAQRLINLKYQVLANPCGITFNPISISNTIMRIIKADSLPEHALIYNGDLWCHPDFHSSFSHPDKDRVIRHGEQSIQAAHEYCKDLSVLIVTLGTAFVYTRKKDDKVVNNCHKIAQSEFNKRLLDVEEIVLSLQTAIHELEKYTSKTLKVLFTLSPVRHLKDGFHENQISKATCLLALEALCKQNKQYEYFPSYEIVLDDLRDYRFYKEDLLHPSDQAVDYIFKKFESSVLEEKEQALRDRISKVMTSLSHRPLNEGSDKHRKFLEKLQKEITELENEYSFIHF